MSERKSKSNKVDMRCDQCEALMINNVFCHETGCPNRNKVKVDGEWVEPEDETESEQEQDLEVF